MNKRKYLGLEIEVFMFEGPDVITASGDYNDENDETEKL